MRYFPFIMAINSTLHGRWCFMHNFGSSLPPGDWSFLRKRDNRRYVINIKLIAGLKELIDHVIVILDRVIQVILLLLVHVSVDVSATVVHVRGAHQWRHLCHLEGVLTHVHLSKLIKHNNNLPSLSEEIQIPCCTLGTFGVFFSSEQLNVCLN